MLFINTTRPLLRKIAIFFMIVAICSITVSIIIGTIGTSVTRILFQINSISIDVDKEQIISLEGIKKVSINTSSSDIKITPTNIENLKISYIGKMSTNNKSLKPELVIDKIDSEVKVKTEIDKGSISSFTYSESTNLEIFVPKSYSNALIIETSSGNLDMEGVVLNRFTYNSSSGNANVIVSPNMEFELIASSSSGSVSCKLPLSNTILRDKHNIKGSIGVGTNKMELSTSSGNVVIK